LEGSLPPRQPTSPSALSIEDIMKKTIAVMALSALFAMPIAAQAQQAVTPATGTPTKMKAATTQGDFVAMAVSSNMFEIESSRLALEKSQNADVKRFAQQMIDDHTKAGANLEAALAAGPKSEIPTRLDPKHERMLEELRAASGAQFNALYLQQQLAAHDEAVGLFQGYSMNGEAGPVKEFAAQTLPTLEMHRTMLGKVSAS